MTSNTALGAKLYEEIADDFEYQAAHLLHQANKVRAIAAGQWHPDWPSEEDYELRDNEA